MSGAAIEDELRDFSTRLLEQTGALVEWTDEGRAAVLAPGGVARDWHAPSESFLLAMQPTPGALTVSLTGEFLDLAGKVLQDRVPRTGKFALGERYLKKGEVAELVSRAYSWPNARVRVLGAGPAQVEYQFWSFHASLRSEDSVESNICVTLNTRTRAPVALPDVLEESDLVRATDAPVDVIETEAVRTIAGRIAAHRAVEAAAAFLARMDARLARDERRLRDYYQALIREAGAPDRRTKTVAAPEMVASKKEAVQLELRRKLSELRERYEVTATLTPLAVVSCQIPVLAVDLDVTRKRERRPHVLVWNSLTKALEPLACSRCDRPIFCVYFTETDVAPLCRGCWEQPQTA